jgi:succinoglycan biosynthesis protein ExoM
VKIAIAVVTCRRPAGLARLVASLDELETPAGAEVELLIVENGADRIEPARRPSAGRAISWHHEPRPGIPFARNRALEIAARQGFDAVAFIDDDETASPGWLAALVASLQRNEAAAATGPALPALPPGSPRWATSSGVFEYPRHPDGAVVPWAFTHCVLLRLEAWRASGVRFDERLAFSGGSDTHFFRRLAAAGHRIVWSEDAIAHEWYPPGRITLRWVLQRSYRIGVTDVWIERDVRSRGLPAAGAAALLLRSGRYGLRAPWRVLCGLRCPTGAMVAGLWDLARAVGLVAGLCGSRYEEYRRSHAE